MINRLMLAFARNQCCFHRFSWKRFNSFLQLYIEACED